MAKKEAKGTFQVDLKPLENYASGQEGATLGNGNRDSPGTTAQLQDSRLQRLNATQEERDVLREIRGACRDEGLLTVARHDHDGACVDDSLVSFD